MKFQPRFPSRFAPKCNSLLEVGRVIIGAKLSGVLWAIGAVFCLAVVPCIEAQSYGPPAIAYDGQLLQFTDTSYDEIGNITHDNYNYGQIEIDQNYNVTMSSPTGVIYDPGSQAFFYEGYSTMAFVAVSADGLTFLGVGANLTVRSYYGVVNGIFDGNTWRYPDCTIAGNMGGVVALFENLPDGLVFQVNASPYYLYTAATGLLLDESSGTWPASNVFLAPPQTVYVSTPNTTNDIFQLTGVSQSGGVGWGSVTLTYKDSNFNTVTIGESFNNGSYSGSLFFSNSNYATSCNFDPNSWTLSGFSDPEVAISFNASSGSPVYGPPFLSSSGTLISFSYTDEQGADHYADSANQIQVVMYQNGAVTYHPNGMAPTDPISDAYDPTTSKFNFNGNPNMTNFFGLDSSGNPIGLPDGLLIQFGYSGIGTTVWLNNNGPYQANYTWQKPGGGWGVKYVGLPAGNWFVVSDNAGNFNSQIYVTSDGEMEMDATNGWQLSNAYPPQLYVNGVLCPLHWETNYTGGSGGGSTNGGASYKSADNNTIVTLNWQWNSGNASWFWNGGPPGGGETGGWDGAATFEVGSITGTVISLDPGHPQNGPPLISWNGQLLTFYYTTADGKDLYWNVGDSGGNYSVLVAEDDSVVAMYAGLTFPGTYTPSSSNFDFGTDQAGDPNLDNFFALTTNGSPIGLPPGLTMYFNASGFGNSILLFDGASQPTPYLPDYTFRRPDGTWGVMYVGLPPDTNFLISDGAGNYNSQLYKTRNSETCIDATLRWPVSDVYPAQLYLNGTLLPLQWATNYVAGSGQNTSGGVAYSVSSGTNPIYLNWVANNGITWSWSMSGSSGAWDDGNVFSNLPAGFTIRLDAPPSAPSFGPPLIAWNGSDLTFNGATSQSMGADVYEGSGARVVITPDGAVTVSDMTTGGVILTGTYNPVTYLFHLGSSSFGALAALDSSGTLLAASSSLAVTGTDPIGIIAEAVAGGGSVSSPVESLLSPALVRPLAWEGPIATISGQTITVAGTPWTTDQFDGPNGAYYVEVFSGTKAGVLSDIVSTSSGAITIADDLTSYIAAGDSMRIRQHTTLGQFLGANNSFGFLASDTINGADEVSVFDGTNYTSYFYFNGTGAAAGWYDSSSNPAGSTILNPYDGVSIKRKAANALTIFSLGAVKMGNTLSPISGGQNLLSTLSPVELTLDSSGLYNGSSGLTASGDSSTADLVWIYGGDSPASYWYYDGSLGGSPGWRNSLGAPSGGIPITGTAFSVQRLGGPADWVIPTPAQY